MKKRFTVPFALFMLCALTGCQSGSGQEEIVLKLVDNYQGEYTLSQPIDTGYFFYCSKRNAGKITVSYKGYGTTTYTDEVIGTTFWPKYTGNHTFTYTVGEKTISKVIEVVNEKPTLNIDNYAFFTTKSDRVYFADVYSEISVDYTPESAELEVTQVERAAFDFSINHGDYQFEDVTFREKFFDGSKEGFYRIHVDAVNGTRRVSGVINAIVGSSESAGNDMVLKIGDEYCSNRVVVDPENPNRFILPAARFNTASYVVLAKEKQNYDKIRIKFKGKQCPTFGVFTQPNELTNSFSPYSISDGYLFSLERPYTNRYSVYRGTYEYKTAYVAQYYFGIDNLSNDKYYTITWSFDTHDDIPNASHPELPYLHVIRWEVNELLDVGTENERIGSTVFKIDSEGGWWDKYETNHGYVTIYSSAIQDLTFEVVEL